MEKTSLNILGVELSEHTDRKMRGLVRGFVEDDNQHYIVTPNPEIILHALHDRNLRMILNHADVSVPDGIGLSIAAWILGQKVVERIPGSDLAESIIEQAEALGWKVFLLGGASEKIAEKAAWRLRYVYKNLKIVGHASGGVVEFKAGKWQTSDTKLLQKINDSEAQIVFVGFGCPKQEKWIFQNLDKLPEVKLAMTVGGTIDFWAGVRKRAPLFMRNAGLEWVWRLIIEPSRYKRIWNATMVFIKETLAWRMRMFMTYRSNAAGFVINKNQEVLLVQRANEKNEHWQLPQGGIDEGESIEQGAMREVREETGLKKLKHIATNPHEYKYDWPRWHQLNGGFKGQSQHIVYFYYAGDPQDVAIDRSEISDYQWVYIDDVYDTVHEQRKESMEIALEGFKALEQEE